MTELMSINQILVLGLTNIISGVFLGAGLAIGFYELMKRRMPQWIKEFRLEMIKDNAVSKALEARKNYA